MGKKYIIEIPEDKIADFVGSTHFLMPYMMAGHIGHHDTGLPIKPYTEPDLEQARKEAYDKGYHDGHNVCCENAKDLMEEKKNEAYQHGLADAWEAARKIACDEGIDMNTLCTIFRRGSSVSIIRDYSASEAIAKIKEYEDGKQEIKVGDEVVGVFSDGSKTRPFVFIRGSQEYYFGLYSDTGEFCQGGMNMRKTGRHFPEIAAVLQKMRGEKG